MNKLNVHSEQYKKPVACHYCFRKFSEGYQFKIIITPNRDLLDFFCKKANVGSQKQIRLCKECFSKLYETLEELENIGWETLTDE
jgi:hypothetical protein